MTASLSHLIFLNGFMLTNSMWQDQVVALSGQASISIPDRTRHDDIKMLARDILKDAPERFALAGLSQGGCIAFEIYRQAPERVTRLALLDTSHRADTKTTHTRRLGKIERVKNGELEQVLLEILPILVHDSRLGDKTFCKKIIDMGLSLGPEVFIREQKCIMSRGDYEDLLAKITVPTLVLCGQQDALTPLPIHEEMARGISGANLETIPNCGHLSTIERPDDVNKALLAWWTA